MNDEMKQAQTLINSLEAQRNQAMNQVAQLSATVQVQNERLQELEADFNAAVKDKPVAKKAAK